MGNKEMPKRVKDLKIEGCSRAARKLRWMNGVDEYPSFCSSKDGRQGQSVVEEASAGNGVLQWAVALLMMMMMMMLRW